VDIEIFRRKQVLLRKIAVTIGYGIFSHCVTTRSFYNAARLFISALMNWFNVVCFSEIVACRHLKLKKLFVL